MAQNFKKQDLKVYAPLTEPSGEDVAGGAVAEVTVSLSLTPPLTWDDGALINECDARIHDQASHAFKQAATKHPDPETQQDLNTCAIFYGRLSHALRADHDPSAPATPLGDFPEESFGRLKQRQETDSTIRDLFNAAEKTAKTAWTDFIQQHPDVWARKEEAYKRGAEQMAIRNAESQIKKGTTPN